MKKPLDATTRKIPLNKSPDEDNQDLASKFTRCRHSRTTSSFLPDNNTMTINLGEKKEGWESSLAFKIPSDTNPHAEINEELR